MKTQFLAALLLLAFVAMPIVQAQFDGGISDEDKETFNQILDPILKIYNLVKYTATFIAVLVMLFSGVNYIMSGSDPRKRENAKNMVMYVIIGLAIIWAAPFVVQFIVG